MTITLNLPPATVEKLKAQAAASGKDVETFVREAVEVKLAVCGRSFREIMAPVHDDFRRSGMTEAELEALVDKAVADARAARKVFRKQPRHSRRVPRDPLA
jgi:hypothetical protein